jgi:hypothetical protein
LAAPLGGLPRLTRSSRRTPRDIEGLFREPIVKIRETRADMDGVRNFIHVDGNPIKFEIIHEARITLSPPSFELAGVPALALDDPFAEKLLANADRTGPCTRQP